MKKAVMALLDAEAIQVDEDGVKGIEEQIKKLRETDSYLFGTDKEPVAPLRNTEPVVIDDETASYKNLLENLNLEGE